MWNASALLFCATIADTEINHDWRIDTQEGLPPAVAPHFPVDVHPTLTCCVVVWVTAKPATRAVGEDAATTIAVERVSEGAVGTPAGRGADTAPPLSGTAYP